MFIKRYKTLVAALALLGSVAFGIGLAQANPKGTITVTNSWPATATYSAALSSCTTATVVPSFVSISSGDSAVHAVTSSFPTTLSCQVHYTAGARDCRFVISRVTTQTCNPLTGICTKTWNYPQVVKTAGGGASCTSTFTSVSDTNAVVTTTNGAFSATLGLH